MEWKNVLLAKAWEYAACGLDPYTYNGSFHTSLCSPYSREYASDSGGIVLHDDGTYSVLNCATEERRDDLTEDQVEQAIVELGILNEGWQ